MADQGEMQTTVDMVRSSTLEIIQNLALAPNSLRVAAGDVSVELTWNPAIAPPLPETGQQATAPTPAALPSDGHLLRSPAVGTFYRSPQPGAAPFVVPGDAVRPGQQVAIVEAMKLMIPVEADQAGLVAEVLAEDAMAVEYGAPLIRLEPFTEA
jgi:acetyl-CoA carboxylase biotin carboxyl carrier protein